MKDIKKAPLDFSNSAIKLISFFQKRKLGDSNPRYGCPYVSLANWWFQPLTQTSFLLRFLADSNRRTRFCRPLTKPLIQGTNNACYRCFSIAVAKVRLFFDSASVFRKKITKSAIFFLRDRSSWLYYILEGSLDRDFPHALFAWNIGLCDVLSKQCKSKGQFLRWFLEHSYSFG